MNENDNIISLWIARDNDGTLRFWKYKPNKNGNRFIHGYNMGELNREMYPEITWENSPIRIEFKINKMNETT